MIFRKHKFKLKTIVAFVAVIVVVVSYSLAAIVLHVNMSDFLKEKVTNSSFSNAKQISKKVEMSFSEVESLTKRISGSNVLKEYIEEYNLKKSIPFEKRYITRQINSFLDNAKVYAEGVEAILFVLPDEHFYVGGDYYKDHVTINFDELIDSPFYDLLDSTPKKPVLLYLDEDVIHDVDSYSSKQNILLKGSTLFVSKVVFDKEVYGIIIIKINDDWINSIIAENNQAAIIDSKNILWKGEQVRKVPVSDVFPTINKKDSGVIEGVVKERVFFNKLSWGEWYLLYFEDLESSANSLKFISY